MKEKINYENCMKYKCERCKYYNYCFKHKTKKENKDVFKSKIKEVEKSQYENIKSEEQPNRNYTK